MKNLNVSYSSSWWYDNRGNRRFRISIEDADSGIFIIQLSLDPENFAKFMSSTMDCNSVSAETWVTPETVHRLGKKMVVETQPLDWDFGWGAKETDPEVIAALEVYKQEKQNEGWETVQVRKSHGKWLGTLRKWVVVEDSGADIEPNS